jgi:hypothetical protein
MHIQQVLTPVLSHLVDIKWIDDGHALAVFDSTKAG